MKSLFVSAFNFIQYSKYVKNNIYDIANMLRKMYEELLNERSFHYKVYLKMLLQSTSKFPSYLK